MAQGPDWAQGRRVAGVVHPDGRYGVPLNGSAQVDDGRSNSIADEDPLLLLRIGRLKNPRAQSQHPVSHITPISTTMRFSSMKRLFRKEIDFC